MSGLLTNGADSLLHPVSPLLVHPPVQILLHLKQKKKKQTLFVEIREFEEEVFVIFRTGICQNPVISVPTQCRALVNTFEAERGSNWIEKIPFLSLNVQSISCALKSFAQRLQCRTKIPCDLLRAH